MRSLLDPSLTLRVKQSEIHDQGLFAKRPIGVGRFICEYTGPLISLDVAQRVDQSYLVHLFQIELGREMSAYIDGSSDRYARFANHSCSPNAMSVQISSRVFFVALRNILPKEEITISYSLGNVADYERNTKFKCLCGADNCRGTMAEEK